MKSFPGIPDQDPLADPGHAPAGLVVSLRWDAPSEAGGPCQQPPTWTSFPNARSSSRAPRLPSRANHGIPASVRPAVNEVIVHRHPPRQGAARSDIISIDCGDHRRRLARGRGAHRPPSAESPRSGRLISLQPDAVHWLGPGRAGHRMTRHRARRGVVGRSAVPYASSRSTSGRGIGTRCTCDPPVSHLRRTCRLPLAGVHALAVEPMVVLSSPRPNCCTDGCGGQRGRDPGRAHEPRSRSPRTPPWSLLAEGRRRAGFGDRAPVMPDHRRGCTLRRDAPELGPARLNAEAEVAGRMTSLPAGADPRPLMPTR